MAKYVEVLFIYCLFAVLASRRHLRLAPSERRDHDWNLRPDPTVKPAGADLLTGRHSRPKCVNLREFDLKLGKVFYQNSSGCIDRRPIVLRGTPADEDGNVVRKKAP
jgi:hypothetical protein